MVLMSGPREAKVVPSALKVRRKNSQSFVSGEKPECRFTMASVGRCWMMVPTG